MPTTPMWRVTTVVTGVAGSPYYIRAYFDQEGGTLEQARQDWHALVGGSPSSVPTGGQVITQAEVAIIDPVTGDAIGSGVGLSNLSVTGANTGAQAPHSSQTLLRWRTNAYQAGRRIQGRTNLPMLFVTQLDGQGNLSAATISGADTAATAFLAKTSSTHVVWSKKYGAWAPTATVSTWNKPSVLRGRRD